MSTSLSIKKYLLASFPHKGKVEKFHLSVKIKTIDDCKQSWESQWKPCWMHNQKVIRNLPFINAIQPGVIVSNKSWINIARYTLFYFVQVITEQ